MADGSNRRYWRYFVAAGIPIGLSAGFVALGVVPLLVPDDYAPHFVILPKLLFVELPIGLSLGFLAGVFWLPACRMLRGHPRELLGGLLAGVLAGWFVGFLFEGPFVCAWESIKLSIEAVFEPVLLEARVGTEPANSCMRDFRLVSNQAARGALGSIPWVLIYRRVAMRPSGVRRKTPADDPAS